MDVDEIEYWLGATKEYFDRINAEVEKAKRS
jgi:hypothetical protein